MKNALSGLLLLMAIKNTYSQKLLKDEFILTGSLHYSGFVYLQYPDVNGNFIKDSSAVKNGKFSFRGSISQPTLAFLIGPVKSRNVEDFNFTEIFLEPSIMTARVEINKFKKINITGSKTQAQFQWLEQKKSTASTRDSIQKIDLKFIADHPASFLAAYLLQFYVGDLSLDSLKFLYSAFNSAVKQSAFGKEVAAKINKIESGSPGAIAYNFSSTDVNGNSLSLSQFKNKNIILLDFWASWCLPCRKSHPELRQIYRQYKNKGLEIIGIASDDRHPDVWKTAIQKDSIGEWRHILRGLQYQQNRFDHSNDISDKYGIIVLPTKILIDKNGIIIGRYNESDFDHKELKKKLKEALE